MVHHRSLQVTPVPDSAFGKHRAPFAEVGIRAKAV
jgi:hypothetical protein